MIFYPTTSLLSSIILHLGPFVFLLLRKRCTTGSPSLSTEGKDVLLLRRDLPHLSQEFRGMIITTITSSTYAIPLKQRPHQQFSFNTVVPFRLFSIIDNFHLIK